ncbi:MAG: PilZ domain-containing protein [Candidatus Scalinduaceae bacterium]
MTNLLGRLEKRSYVRLELTMPLKLLNYKVNTKNISPGGVYFEVVTDNTKPFSPGETVKFEILAKTSTVRFPSGIIRLTGSGIIVRNEKICNNGLGKKIGIALVFTDKLEILFD